jgi:death-on-curing family protein
MPIQISERIVDIVHNYVVHRLVAVEGIMYFGTVSGSLERIFYGFHGQIEYKGVLEQAGAILYSIVHGHSFSDGNKRTGLLTTHLHLLFNGFYLTVPNDTTKFLERMADALDPKAPSEHDAIVWIKRNCRKSVSASLISNTLTIYCRLRGTHLLEVMTTMMLEQGLFPEGLDKNKLTDKTLKQQPIIACSKD